MNLKIYLSILLLIILLMPLRFFQGIIEFISAVFKSQNTGDPTLATN